MVSLKKALLNPVFAVVLVCCSYPLVTLTPLVASGGCQKTANFKRKLILLRAKRVLYNLYTKIIQNRSLTKPSHPTSSTLCWASILLPTWRGTAIIGLFSNLWIPNLDTPQKINGWKPDNTSLGKVHIIFQTIIFRFELLIFRGVYRFSAECWYFCHPKKKQANHANSWQHLTPSGDPTLLSLSQWNFSSSFQKSGNL